MIDEPVATEAIKTIRRECGRIERDLREQFPDAAAVFANYDQSAVDALSEEAMEALRDLWRLRDVRQDLRTKGYYATEYLLEWDYHWPSRYPKPTTPEIEGIRAAKDERMQQK